MLHRQKDIFHPSYIYDNLLAQTDRKWRIRAHRAICTGGLKKKHNFLEAVFLSGREDRPQALYCFIRSFDPDIIMSVCNSYFSAKHHAWCMKGTFFVDLLGQVMKMLLPILTSMSWIISLWPERCATPPQHLVKCLLNNKNASGKIPLS